jgi:CRISPR-associated protein Csm3
MKRLIKKIRIRTTIELLTGLHIGGSKDSVEIGGIDLPVIKLAFRNNQPYIPGSSLKGKMRCLLEQTEGATEVGKSDKVNKLFGNAKDNSHDNRPSRLIVRDAMLTPESLKRLEESDDLDMPFTENKFENTIDRMKGVAGNPRQSERVPAGAKFDVEFIINVWDEDDVSEKDLTGLFEKGISLLESDYLGGSGSRGYGQVKFGKRETTELSEENGWKA